MNFEFLFKQTWSQFIAKIVKLILFFIVGGLLSITIILIPCVAGGMTRELLKLAREGKEPEFNQLWSFEGYGQIVLFLLVGGLLIMIGYMLLIIPGIIFTVWWMYALYFIVDRNMDFWSAMSASKELVGKAGFWNNFGLLLIMVVLNALGNSVVVGGLFTTPFCMLLLTNAYESMSKA